MHRSWKSLPVFNSAEQSVTADVVIATNKMREPVKYLIEWRWANCIKSTADCLRKWEIKCSFTRKNHWKRILYALARRNLAGFRK